jgi:hypothetical protein
LVFIVCALIVTEPPNGIGNGVPSQGKTAKGSTGLDMATDLHAMSSTGHIPPVPVPRIFLGVSNTSRKGER